jgi:hypothetical protein
MSSPALESALQDLWQHITSDRQAWLFGAGISFAAGIPLMYQLTKYVRNLVTEKNTDKVELLRDLEEDLPDDMHVEHILSHIGDLIALAERSRTKSVLIASKQVSLDTLKQLYQCIVDHIGDAVRYGYREGSDHHPEQRGSQTSPIVDVEGHRSFVRQLFRARVKPGVGQSPITFFTTNYDTLLEDALALERKPFVDGFTGGAMAYWDPEHTYNASVYRTAAKVVKLHGSVDWHRMEDGGLVRCRAGCLYPNKVGNLLIYPQSTKYVATQRDPFASLFSHLRATLAAGPDNVLGICGYSFGDDHINDEIEAAMAMPLSKTVIVAFAGEIEVGGVTCLPPRLDAWLTDRPWSSRVFVASRHGLYHGSTTNLLNSSQTMDWWTFSGLTRYLMEGPEFVPSAPTPATTPASIPTPAPAGVRRQEEATGVLEEMLK